jgi:hypothetical protein
VVVPQGDKMSDVSNVNGADKTKTGSNQEEDKFVSKSAYEEVSKDMHKYKSTNKELLAKLNEREAEIKAIEEGRMAEQNQWKELAERREKEKADAEAALKRTQEHYTRSVKMSALLQELGDVKPKYLAHADLDGISVHEDGSVNSETVIQVANKFRQENPELVPGKNNVNITDNAPTNNTFTNKQQMDLDSMSVDEKRDLIANAPRSRTSFRRNNTKE